MKHLPLAALLALVVSAPFARAGDPDVAQDDMTALSLEELMDIEVSVASRSRQKLSDAPAAVYVLTNEEIRRSGATSIQEALRMVPGFLVGHWQTTLWDATSRGFTSSFNHNLLVMIDGVNVYTMMTTEGVAWNLQEIDLVDVERIEVVRGPGAALWGNNAVNGVINVVTKHSKDTQGWQANSVFGNEGTKGALRYGGTFDDGGTFRVFSVASQHNAMSDYSTGEENHNEDWWIARAGFRGDWNLEGESTLSVAANVFDSEKEQNYGIDLQNAPFFRSVHATTPEVGGSVVAALERPHADGDVDRFVASYLRNDKNRIDYRSQADVVDLDWQRRTALSSNQTLTYGMGWRFVAWVYDGGFSLNNKPEHGTVNNVRAFAFDEFAFPDKNLSVVLGAEIEHNDFTGLEFQPTARAMWQPTERHSVWSAISRAVRTPSLDENYDYSQAVNTGPTDVYLWKGNTSIESEEVLAFELGWRWRACERLSFDTVAFYNDLDNVVTREDGAVFTQGGITYTPFTVGNHGAAQAWGVEIGSDVQLTEAWRVRTALTHFEQHNQVESSSTDAGFEDNNHLFPQTIANLRSYYDLGEHWELDAALYYVNSIHLYGTPAYLRTDVRIGYSPSPDWRFSIGVQNATDPAHPEDGGDQVARNVWAGLSWSR